jgi:hypothetical protein
LSENFSAETVSRNRSQDDQLLGVLGQRRVRVVQYDLVQGGDLVEPVQLQTALDDLGSMFGFWK